LNFLIDEANFINKGANAVVSYLHLLYENYGIDETNVHLHCDNCSGQNENKSDVILCLDSTVGLHKSITLNFMIAGHCIKFAPDWYFGLLKQAFRRHAVSSLQEMASVVNGSALVNMAQPFVLLFLNKHLQKQ